MSKSKLWENARAILVALLLALCLRTFVIDHYMVPTGSMVPTIDIGDRLFALKFFYGAVVPFMGVKFPAVREPRRGDIVVFQQPFYEKPALTTRMFDPLIHALSFGLLSIDRQPRFYVKRCIGVPGDVIQIIGKVVYVNGMVQEVQWPEYHRDPSLIPPGDDLINRRDYYGPVIVPDGHYFMLGDNRDESYDSRFWGFVEFENIYGKAFLRVWPLRGLGILK
jgi:signal peptidase I